MARLNKQTDTLLPSEYFLMFEKKIYTFLKVNLRIICASWFCFRLQVFIQNQFKFIAVIFAKNIPSTQFHRRLQLILKNHTQFKHSNILLLSN